MKAKSKACIANQRKFDGDWDEVDYCYHKILYWFYARRNRARASRFCRTLEMLLQKVANKHEAIKSEECWSLLYEVRSEFVKAILYRRHEIRLIKKLQKLGARPQGVYDACDLADRWILLGMLYKEANNIREAIRAVREAKRICVRSRVTFGSADLLGEYEAELHGPVRASSNQCRFRRDSNQKQEHGIRRRKEAWTGVNETI